MTTIDEAHKATTDPLTQRAYNKTSYEKHKDTKRKVCSICFGTYTYYNKSHHNKTERHLRGLNSKTAVLDQIVGLGEKWCDLEETESDNIKIEQ